MSPNEYQDSRHIRSWRKARKALLKRDNGAGQIDGEEERKDPGEGEGQSRMYGITRHARPTPSPDSSRPVLGSDNTANLKARMGFIILAVSLTYMHREDIPVAPIQPKSTMYYIRIEEDIFPYVYRDSWALDN